MGRGPDLWHRPFIYVSLFAYGVCTCLFCSDSSLFCIRDMYMFLSVRPLFMFVLIYFVRDVVYLFSSLLMCSCIVSYSDIILFLFADPVGLMGAVPRTTVGR